MSMCSLDRRLSNEFDWLKKQLPQLQGLVELEKSFGRPPKAYQLRLCPFGFLLRESESTEPETYEPFRHGKVELILSIDPCRYHYSPWSATLRMKRGCMVFNPHVGTKNEALGAVCWIDGSQGYRPADWPVHLVLPHVLRILSGEVFAFEGQSLNEDAKIWFKRSIVRLPFARVPDASLLVGKDGSAPDPAVEANRLVQASTLGIEVQPMEAVSTLQADALQGDAAKGDAAKGDALNLDSLLNFEIPEEWK